MPTRLKEPAADKGEMQETHSPRFVYFFSPLSDPQNNSQSNVSGGAQAHFETGIGNVRNVDVKKQIKQNNIFLEFHLVGRSGGNLDLDNLN